MKDYDGTEYPDAESSARFAGIPDGFQRLWTPHRIAYIEQGPTSPGDECVFCTAPTLTDEQALIVHRGELGYVILNLFPYNSGHLLVVPYRHVARYDEATPAETAEIAGLTQTAMRALGATSRAEGFNIGMNQGTIAGRGNLGAPASARRTAVGDRRELLPDRREDESPAETTRRGADGARGRMAGDSQYVAVGLIAGGTATGHPKSRIESS